MKSANESHPRSWQWRESEYHFVFSKLKKLSLQRKHLNGLLCDPGKMLIVSNRLMFTRFILGDDAWLFALLSNDEIRLSICQHCDPYPIGGHGVRTPYKGTQCINVPAIFKRETSVRYHFSRCMRERVFCFRFHIILFTFLSNGRKKDVW